MNILILGGTGAMGEALVPILVEKGYSICVTSRSERKSNNSNVIYVKGNAHNEEFIERLLEKSWDVIVDFMIYNTNEFSSKVNKMLNKTKQYFFISSARVYADNEDKIQECSSRLLDVCKDEKYLATDEYAITKARQENLLINSGKSNWTIIRPYITYNDYRMQLGAYEKEDWLYRFLKGRTVVFSKDLMDKYTTLTHSYDVAYGIAQLIGQERAYGEVFHMTCGKPCTWKVILEIYQNTLKDNGIETKVILADKAEEIIPLSKYQLRYDRLYNRRFDDSKISQCVESKKSYEPSVGLRICLENFINKPKWLYINWTTQASMDRKVKECTKLSEITGAKEKIKYILFRYIISYDKYLRMFGKGR